MENEAAAALINVQRGLWVACLTAQTLLVGKLCYERLLRRYFWFAVYLTAEITWGVILVQVDYRMHAYAQLFRIYQTMLIVLRFAMAAELYERICEHFYGIGRFRLGLAAVIVSLGAVISLVLFHPSIGGQWAFPQTLVLVLWRFQTGALCVASLLARFALHQFLNVRPPLRPNVRAHWTLTTLYFAISAMSGMAVLLIGGGKGILPVNLTMLAADLACLLLWIGCFRKNGETIPRVSPTSSEQQAYQEAVMEAVIKEVEKLVKERY